jgi:serine O-acetyltransferase
MESPANSLSWASTRQRITEDLRFLSRSRKWRHLLITLLLSTSFQAIALYRLSAWVYTKGRLSILSTILDYFLHILTGCYLNPAAEIGRKCRFAHPTGIVIGQGVKIGDRATIFQNVTIGSHGNPAVDKKYPVIGDDVTVYAGAIIIGPVQIGDGATIGAASVVLTDVPANATAVGVPARIIAANQTR